MSPRAGRPKFSMWVALAPPVFRDHQALAEPVPSGSGSSRNFRRAVQESGCGGSRGDVLHFPRNNRRPPRSPRETSAATELAGRSGRVRVVGIDGRGTFRSEGPARSTRRPGSRPSFGADMAPRRRPPISGTSAGGRTTRFGGRLDLQPFEADPSGMGPGDRFGLSSIFTTTGRGSEPPGDFASSRNPPRSDPRSRRSSRRTALGPDDGRLSTIKRGSLQADPPVPRGFRGDRAGPRGSDRQIGSQASH